MYDNDFTKKQYCSFSLRKLQISEHSESVVPAHDREIDEVK